VRSIGTAFPRSISFNFIEVAEAIVTKSRMECYHLHISVYSLASGQHGCTPSGRAVLISQEAIVMQPFSMHHVELDNVKVWNKLVDEDIPEDVSDRAVKLQERDGRSKMRKRKLLHEQ
jgi:hypothetical protein